LQRPRIIEAVFTIAHFFIATGIRKLDLFPSSGNIGNMFFLRIIRSVDFVHRQELQGTRKHNVSEAGSVSVFRLEEEDTYSVGSLSKNNVSHWTQIFLRDPTEYVSSPPLLKTEIYPVSGTLCFLVYRTPDDGQSPQTW
jgi:hypothetical protein